MPSVIKFSNVEMKDSFGVVEAANFTNETEYSEALNLPVFDLEEDVASTELMSEVEAEIRARARERAKVEADAQAKEIVKKAHEEAELIRVQAREDAKIELENARKDGFSSGTQQAMDEVNAKFDSQIEQVKNLVDELETHKSDFIRTHNEEMKESILQIVEKVVNEKVEHDDKIFLSIYKKAVADLSRQDWIKVSVAEKDFELATTSKDLLLSMLKGNPAFTIEVLRDAPDGTCVIETNTGVSDASIDVQLERTKEIILQADLLE